MRSVLTMLLLFLCSWTWAQEVTHTDFISIDERSAAVPNSVRGYENIAHHLSRDLTSEKEKVRALYIWVTHNIRYDLNQLNTRKRYTSNTELIDEVLTERKGICQHYSELIHAMCSSVNIKSEVLRGYTRGDDGKISEESHSWNSVEIDSEFYVMDCTWAAGYKYQGNYVHEFRDNYFLIDPRVSIKTHMPFDPIWQFLDNPIDHREFATQNFTKLETEGRFAYRDSIRAYEQLDLLTQLRTSNERITSAGAINSLIQSQISENNFQLTNIRYNTAIDTLNYGIENFNRYITFKNGQFRKPKIEDAEIVALISNAESGILQADRIMYGLVSDNAELSALIIEAKNRMPELITEIERERIFVDQYVSKWKPLRIMMF